MNNKQKEESRIQNLKDILIEHAQVRKRLTYQELAIIYNDKRYETDIKLVPSAGKMPKGSILKIHGECRLDYLLGRINEKIKKENNDKIYRILLTVIVINKATQLPGDGFDDFILQKHKTNKTWLNKMKNDKKAWRMLISAEQNDVFDEYDLLSLNANNIENSDLLEYVMEVYYLMKFSKRSLSVKAEVLKKANGICQFCNKPAPFKDKNGKPFLEVHHRIYLSQRGGDSIENCEALCPNCHRKKHFG